MAGAFFVFRGLRHCKKIMQMYKFYTGTTGECIKNIRFPDRWRNVKGQFECNILFLLKK